MTKRSLTCLALVAASLGLLLVPATVLGQAKLSAEKAGTIGALTGKIAFIRDKNVWTMDVSGINQTTITEVGNASGRLSWSPDGKKIAFTRQGKVNLQGPDNLGGNHKVYDVFLAYVDSAANGNTTFWYRLTDGIGSRDPEWSADGKTLLYYKDMNANYVNAFLPNYQVCLLTPPESGTEELLRKDWQNMPEFFVAPTMSPDGMIAFVHMVKTSEGGFRRQGIAKLHRDSFMAKLETVGAQSQKMAGLVAPAWSPDGQWLACVSNSMTDPGLYLLSADFSERYLVFKPPPATDMITAAPSFSPDSKRLTFGTRDGSIWICDITGNGARRLTGPGMDTNPAWSK